MTLPSIDSSPELSPEEWEEAKALLKAISEAPSAVVPEQMERFSYLFTRSLMGKSDSSPSLLEDASSKH